MTDESVKRELEANHQRETRNQEDDDSIVDTFEKAVDPIVRAIGKNPDDDGDELARSAENDAEQRPG